MRIFPVSFVGQVASRFTLLCEDLLFVLLQTIITCLTVNTSTSLQLPVNTCAQMRKTVISWCSNTNLNRNGLLLSLKQTKASELWKSAAWIYLTDTVCLPSQIKGRQSFEAALYMEIITVLCEVWLASEMRNNVGQLIIIRWCFCCFF